MNRVFLLLCTLSLQSCVVVSVPVDETLNLVVSGVSELWGGAPDALPCPLRFEFDSVCIEYNREVAIPDFVPAVQNRLNQLKIANKLYAPSAISGSCSMVLRYTATRSWGAHFTSSDKQDYLSEAELNLQQGGQLISQARYQISRLGYEKWSSTAAKLSSVVDDLVCKKSTYQLFK